MNYIKNIAETILLFLGILALLEKNKKLKSVKAFKTFCFEFMNEFLGLYKYLIAIIVFPGIVMCGGLFYMGYQQVKGIEVTIETRMLFFAITIAAGVLPIMAYYIKRKKLS